MNHGVPIEGVVDVGGGPTAQVRSDAVESAAGEGGRQLLTRHLRQLHVGQLGVYGHPVAGRVATSVEGSKILGKVLDKQPTTRLLKSWFFVMGLSAYVD